MSMSAEWARISDKVPTLRKNSGRIWSPKRRRWLLWKERVACMGFVVYEDLARALDAPLDV